MVRYTILLMAAVAALPCHAAPWGRHDGEFYSRVAVSRGEVEGLASARLDTYGEYGLSESLTATVKYEAVQFDNYPEFSADGWRATLRKTFRLTSRTAFSFEAGALQGEAIGGAAGCQSLGVEARSGLGRSFPVGKDAERSGFWFAEAALRAHDDGCLRRRIELGYGQEIYPSIWLVTQAWLDEGDENSSSRKYQAEYLWRTPVGDLSAGTLVELGGAFEETAIFVAMARRF